MINNFTSSIIETFKSMEEYASCSEGRDNGICYHCADELHSIIEKTLKEYTDK